MIPYIRTWAEMLKRSSAKPIFNDTQEEPRLTDAEIDALFSPELRAWVAAHRQDDPHRLALQRHQVDFPLPLAIGQVSLLQKAAVKLPKMANAQCIFLQRAYEQATSETVAALKPWGTGATALDLTCGLGSDSFTLATHYAQVTSLEADPQLAKIAQFNARLLDISGIKIVNTTAEDFLQSYNGSPFDLIYADPDRRDKQGKRVFGLQDCQPDVLALLPLMRQHSKRILIKASPMLDIQAIQRLFPEGSLIAVVSEGNENKEILIQPDYGYHRREAYFFRKGRSESISAGPSDAFNPTWDTAEAPAYILEPDTALYKAGLVAEWFEHDELGGGLTSPEGYFYSPHDDPEFHGHRFRILEYWPWKPHDIKSALKRRGISKVQYSRRDFDLPMETVRKQVGLPEGGELFLLLTTYGKRGRWAFLAARMT